MIDEIFLVGDLQGGSCRSINNFKTDKNYLNYLSEINKGKVIVNLEGPIINYKNPKKSIKTGPHVCSSPEIFTAFEGCDVLWLLANNHIMDYGPEGVKFTLDHLQDSNWIGYGEDRLSSIIKGTDIEIWNVASPEWSSSAYFPSDQGVLNVFSDIDKIESKMNDSSKKKIVVFHGGSERSNVMPKSVMSVFKRLLKYNLIGFIMCHSHKRGLIYYENDVLVCTGLGNHFMETATINEGITLNLNLKNNRLGITGVIATSFSSDGQFSMRKMTLSEYNTGLYIKLDEPDHSRIFPYIYSTLYGKISYFLDIKFNLRPALRKKRLQNLLSYMHDNVHLDALKNTLINELN